MNTKTVRQKRRYRPLSRKKFRRLLLESLEDRRLLASDWQNVFTIRDVNGDKVVSPLDALVGINELNQRQIIPITTGELPDRSDHADAPLYDVNGDGFLSPLDVLLVINGLTDDFQAPEVTVGLQFDSAPGGVADDDRITFAGTITGSAIDDLTGINRVEYSINGGVFQAVAFERDGTFSIQPTLAEGEQTIVVRAFDGRNITGEAEAVEFMFDSTAPEVAFNNSGPHVTRNELLITGQVTDALAGVESLLAQVDLADTVEVPVAADGTFAFTASLPTDSSADGQHLVRFRATDKAGNLSTLTTVEWDLDTRRPVITTNADAIERTALSTIELSFSEDAAATAFTAASYALTQTSGPNAPVNVPISTIQQVDARTAQLVLPAALGNFNYRLNVLPAVTDLAGNTPAISEFNFTIEKPTRLAESSPANGEAMVSLTRETIIRFDGKVDPATITTESFFAIANSERLNASIFVSSTEEYAKLVFSQPLPASTEVRITVDGDAIIGRDGLAVDADGDGVPGGIGTADFTTAPNTRIQGTIVTGRIIASEPDDQGNDVPLEGVTIRVDGLPEANVVTNANGEFTLIDVPVPAFFVHLDGTTATMQAGEPVPNDGRYPSVGKLFKSIPGETLDMDFNIHLPFVPDEAFHAIVEGQEMTVGLPQSQIDEDPMMASVELTIPADSLVLPDGSRATEVGVFRVDSDRLPGPLPAGLNHAFDITVQAEAGAFFDVPAPISFPNVEGKAPGEQMLLMSFDHALGDWVVVGTMTAVDEDGDGTAEKIVSDDGTGLRAPGWHGAQSGATGNGGGGGMGNSGLKHFLQTAGSAAAKAGAIVVCEATAGLGCWAAWVGAAAVHAQTQIAWSELGSGASGEGNSTLTTRETLEAEAMDFLNATKAGFLELTDIILDPATNGQFDREVVDAKLSDLQGIHEGGLVATANRISSQMFAELDVRDLIDTEATPMGEVYYAVLTSDGNIVSRGVTTTAGDYGFVISDPSERFFVLLFDVNTLDSTMTTPFDLPVGATQVEVPDYFFLGLEGRSVLRDTDGDGLPDIGEIVVGTGLFTRDTDNDGIEDLVELQQGLDPLGGRSFPTGIIASTELLGEANEVVVEVAVDNASDQVAYLATGSHGLAVVDVSQFDSPIVQGQLDLLGDSQDVAVDPVSSVAVVAAGDGGLHFIDISDPMMPKRFRTANIDASQVEIVDGVAYATAGARILSYEVVTGDVLTTTLVSDGTTTTGMAHEGSFLYTMDENRILRAFAVNGFQLSQRGSVELPHGAGRLSVNAGVAYAAAANTNGRGGFSTADVSNPDSLTVISGPDVASGFVEVGNSIAANGSGLGLVVGSTFGGQSLAVMDLSDPAETNQFLTRFDLPATPRSVSIASGIAYVADGTGGLVVVNYVPFDNQGQAPQVTISGPDGMDVQEGSLVPIRVNVTDDVQVRNVELLMNGEVVANDLSAPFDLQAVTPALASGATSVMFQVRATDTGGNVGVSEVLTYDLTPDTTPPEIINSSPTDDGAGFRVSAISLRFDEPIDASRLAVGGFALTNLGPNFRVGGGDDSTVALDRVEALSPRRVVIYTNQPLGEGRYRLTGDATVISDVAGNQVAAPIGITFTSFDLDEQNAVAWISDSDGDWNQPGNWSSGEVPGPNDAVIIDRKTANPTITLPSGNIQIRSLVSREEFVISGGSLSVSEPSEIQARFEISGGMLIANGPRAEWHCRVAVGAQIGVGVTGVCFYYPAKLRMVLMNWPILG